MIINAENLILGRTASYVAKQALLGEEINIINSEKTVLTGKKQEILKKYEIKVERGNPFKGPYFSRTPDKILKRTIRGMLPHKQPKGKEAFKRVKCYIGIPDNLQGKQSITIKKADISKTKSLRYITLEELSRLLRGK